MKKPRRLQKHTLLSHQLFFCSAASVSAKLHCGIFLEVLQLPAGKYSTMTRFAANVRSTQIHNMDVLAYRNKRKIERAKTKEQKRKENVVN